MYAVRARRVDPQPERPARVGRRCARCLCDALRPLHKVCTGGFQQPHTFRWPQLLGSIETIQLSTKRRAVELGGSVDEVESAKRRKLVGHVRGGRVGIRRCTPFRAVAAVSKCLLRRRRAIAAAVMGGKVFGKQIMCAAPRIPTHKRAARPEAAAGPRRLQHQHQLRGR
jgi:hypothetical protein